MERIERKTDENLYQPKIHADCIRGLYRIGQETGQPMTVVLDRAIREFIERYETVKNGKGDVEQRNFLPRADL